ncbi:MAG: ADOP family duplicated permease [Vicinamibacterales bacterium]
MNLIKRLRGRLNVDRDLAEELRAHVDARVDELVDAGATREEARQQARRELGNPTVLAERGRDVWRFALVETTWQDLRYACRQLARAPAFATAAIVTLAIGIGANAAIFGLIDALVLRPLPVHDPQALVQLLRVRNGETGTSFTYPQVERLTEHRELFAGVSGFTSDRFQVGPSNAFEATNGAWVSGGFYTTLGLTPFAGRLLESDDDRRGAAPVAVVSYSYWTRRLSRRPDVIGRPLLVDGVPVTIVGISPPGFSGTTIGEPADITLPLGVLPQVQPERAEMIGPGGRWLQVLARPVNGLTAEQVRARLAAVWTDVVTSAFMPTTTAAIRRRMLDERLDIESGATGTSSVRAQYRTPLYLLLTMVGVVLLIACANVANLLLARAVARRREIAVRLAIGAGRARIVRQLLTESACLAALGTAAGIGVAAVVGPLLVGLISTGGQDVVLNLSPDGRVLAFTIAIAAATTLLFGLAPAFRGADASTNVSGALNAGAGRAPRARVGRVLVVVQVALSLLLLIGGGLFVRTLENLRTLDPGFRSEGVLLVRVDATRAGHDRAALRRFNESIVAETERIPGVRSASLSLVPPLLGGGISLDISVDGEPIEGSNGTESDVHIVAPHYFATLGTPVLRGREFTPDDNESAPPVVIVNEAFAKRYMGPGDPLMRRVSVIGFGPLSSKNAQVVGVVKNAVYEHLRDAPPPTVYAPYAQLGDFDVTMEVYAPGMLAPVAAAIRRQVQPKLPPFVPLQMRTMQEQIEGGLVRERVMAVLGTTFGLLALLLAAVGLYGILSYAVARRTNEIGIRIALGATRPEVLSVVLRDAVWMLAIGVALGLPTAWMVSRVAGSLLFGLSPNDPATVAGALTVLLSVGLAASLFPASRASRVDPVVALRQE